MYQTPRKWLSFTGRTETSRLPQRSGFALVATVIEVLLIGLLVWGVIAGTSTLFSSIQANPLASSEHASDGIFALAVTSNGKELYIHRGVTQFFTLDLQSETISRKFRRMENSVNNSKISGDGVTRVLSIDEQEFVIFRRERMVAYQRLQNESTPMIALSSNGQTAILAFAEGDIMCWDLTGEEPVESEYRFAKAVERIAIDALGQQLVIATTDGSLHIVEPHTGEIRKSLPAVAALSGDPVVSDDGIWLLVPCGGSVVLYDIRSCEIQWVYRTDDPIGFRSVAISPDGKLVATNCILGGIQILDRTDGAIFQSFPVQHLHRAMTFSMSSDIVYTAGSDGMVRAFSVHEKKEHRRINIGELH